MSEPALSETLRLCLDLNVWVADVIGRRKPRRNGLWLPADQELARLAMQGRCDLCPVQIVVSWGMLNRLRMVLTERPDLRAAADLVVDAIASRATLGPDGMAPHLILGGTGIVPTPLETKEQLDERGRIVVNRESDPEDQHVLDTAIAGRAHVLATSDFGGFVTNDTEPLIEDRAYVHAAPTWEVLVARPQAVAGWLRDGIFPTAERIRALVAEQEQGPRPG